MFDPRNTCHLIHETPIQDSEHPIRSFDPFWNELYKGHPSDILSTCPCCSDQKLRVRSRRPGQTVDNNSVVIAVDGACRDEGKPSAVASYAVYYGKGSGNNDADHLYNHMLQTSQTGELYAAQRALQMVVNVADDPDALSICKVLILTHSSSLVKGMSDHIWKWKKNGFRTAKKQPVVNGEIFDEINDFMEVLEDQGIPVWFWLVPKKFNQEASSLANFALDNPKPKLFSKER